MFSRWFEIPHFSTAKFFLHSRLPRCSAKLFDVLCPASGRGLELIPLILMKNQIDIQALMTKNKTKTAWTQEPGVQNRPRQVRLVEKKQRVSWTTSPKALTYGTRRHDWWHQRSGFGCRAEDVVVFHIEECVCIQKCCRRKTLERSIRVWYH